jgi:hypothetical protein
MTQSLIIQAAHLVGWGNPTSDAQTEALREYGPVASVAGDSEDWIMAVIVHILVCDLVTDGVTVPAGTYVRVIDGSSEGCYLVTSTDTAMAYAQAIESAWQAEQDSE